MNNYDKYYNDPDIINDPKPLREIHAIRLMISDETKDMTPQERTQYYKRDLDKLSETYGFKVASRTQ